MKTVSILLWTAVFAGAMIGATLILISFKGDFNAVQQTSVFALAMVLLVMPYCTARAFDEIFREFRK